MGDSAFKCRLNQPAGAAHKIGVPARHLAKVRDAQILAAAGTEHGRLCGKVVPAGGANGNVSQGCEGFAADAAISRKEDGSDTIQRISKQPGISNHAGTSKHANHCTPCRGLA